MKPRTKILWLGIGKQYQTLQKESMSQKKKEWKLKNLLKNL